MDFFERIDLLAIYSYLVLGWLIFNLGAVIEGEKKDSKRVNAHVISFLILIPPFGRACGWW